MLGQRPLLPTTMATYTEAMNEFTKNANAFIEQLPLLNKARNAYEQAMRANAELRKLLDTGEENLRALMTRLEQIVSPASEKRRPEGEPSQTCDARLSGETACFPSPLFVFDTQPLAKPPVRKNGKAGSRKAGFFVCGLRRVWLRFSYRTWGSVAEPILVPITSPDTTNSTRRFC